MRIPSYIKVRGQGYRRSRWARFCRARAAQSLNRLREDSNEKSVASLRPPGRRTPWFHHRFSRHTHHVHNNSGTASGQLGSSSFSNALVTVTATGDTDNLVAGWVISTVTEVPKPSMPSRAA